MRLLVVLSVIAVFSTVLALVVQDRALSRDLERAAERRLDRASVAAGRLVLADLEDLQERYRAISGTPQLRANLEVQHAPTLAYYTGQLRDREGTDLLAFLDRDGRVTASSGDETLLPLLSLDDLPTLTTHGGRPYFVTRAQLATRAGPVGTMVAIDRVEPATFETWSELCGADVGLRADPGRSDEHALTRIVRPAGELQLVVTGSLEDEREALRHSRVNLVTAGWVALALSFLACIGLSRGFVRPILAIQHATERIRAGEFDMQVADGRNDEIGDVARAFDLMLADLRESRRQVQAHVDELDRSRTHLSNAQRLARIGSFELDVDSGLLVGSEEFRALYQIESGDKPIEFDQVISRIHPEDRGDVDDAFRVSLREGTPLVLDYRSLQADGGERILHAEARVDRDAAGRITGLEGTVQDITERRRADEQIRFLAYHDSLTGLGNRLLFTERLAFGIAKARRGEGALGILFLDLDHFKRINDTLGHSVGDELLRSVADRIVQCVRVTDTIVRDGNDFDHAVSRFGGDEFTILLADLDHAQDASRVAVRILDQLRQPFDLRGREVVVGASIGIAAWPHDGDDTDTLLRNADSAMYHAKQQGRNNYQFYTESMNAAATRRLELEERLRSGLSNGEFEVHYQPKLDLRTQKVTGFEALVRWRDPERGLVAPGAFIPVAEETGLIQPLGEEVIRQTCEQIAAWERDDSRPLGFHRVSVNISAHQFRGGDLVDRLGEILEETGANAERLEIEITESTVLHDEESVIAQLDRLREMGITVSLDDFGTGYSSLSYLRRIPVDTLKIDMSFVQNITHSKEDADLTAAIVSMGKARGLRVVAEGVETLAQRRLLTQWGCDEIQGFLIAAALPVAEAGSVRGAEFSES